MNEYRLKKRGRRGVIVLVAAGLMRLPLDKKKDDFLDLPAPRVSPNAVRTAIRAERDED